MSRWAAVLLVVAIAAAADNKTEQQDIRTPRGSADGALVSALHTATIATTNLEESLLFYRDGMGLTAEGPIELSTEAREAQRQLWSMPDDLGWETWLLRREGVDEAIQIQLLVLDRPMPAIHRSWNSLELGPFSLGFPNTRQAALDAELRRLGFGSQAPMSEYSVSRPDGSRYPIQETIFNGPDFVKGVGIFRGGGMAQLSPVDDATGMGGPGYSAQVVSDGDETIAFFTDFLDFEVRADREWTTSGALGAPAGTTYRFMILYARGATSRHLLMLDYLNAEPIDVGVPRRLPYRGLGMWTFQVADLARMIERAIAIGIEIIGERTCYDSPHQGTHCAITVLSPDGFLIELVEPASLHQPGPDA